MGNERLTRIRLFFLSDENMSWMKYRIDRLVWKWSDKNYDSHCFESIRDEYVRISFFLKLLFYLARTFYIIGQNFATEYPLEWNSKIKVRFFSSHFHHEPEHFRFLKEILSKLNEIVPEKTGGKRIDSRGGSGFHHSASTLEHESIDEEILAELNRRKVRWKFEFTLTAFVLETHISQSQSALCITKIHK